MTQLDDMKSVGEKTLDMGYTSQLYRHLRSPSHSKDPRCNRLTANDAQLCDTKGSCGSIYMNGCCGSILCGHHSHGHQVSELSGTAQMPQQGEVKALGSLIII